MVGAMKSLLRVALLATMLVVPATADAFTARGSVGQAYVIDARPNERLTLLYRDGTRIGGARADRLGSFIFRDLSPMRGLRVRRADGRLSRPFAVLSQRSNPPRSFFRRKRLKAGLNYVTMRDGVELAMTVRLPAGKTLADGPFPTLIEHSGYQVAAPKDLLQNIAGGSKPDPLVPASGTFVGSVIGPLLDFAVVSVQMRGSGCSGGAFDLFDLPTTFDGYDMVEAVAAQRWVKGGKVGLFGISFSGITQLFTAGTRPPHLAAVAPMSVIDDVYSSTGFPGGIFNSGFARSWIVDRMNDAKPAPAGGQPWARALTRAGDRHCIANQKLRLQTQDALAIQRATPFRDEAVFGDRSAARWMRRVDVPTFLVGQFQDEQTGGHFAESLGTLAGNPRTWITLQNGVHVDSLGPDVLTRWVEFLNLYVADRIPRISDTVLSLGDTLYKTVADAPASKVAQSRFAGTTDVAAARAAFERDPRVRILMDNGAGPAGPGALGAAWELPLSSWPVREARATALHLGANGALDPAAAGQRGTVSYTGDPRARPQQTLPGDGEADAWKAQPPYRWAPVAAGKGVGFATAPLAADTVIAGTSSLDLWMRSTARDTDLQVTLSEIRPDGAETYVQNGWLRASHRKLASTSTANDPVPTHRQRDAAPLPRGRDELVRVPLFPVAHAFRAGSRIRVTVTAPGGDRPRWRFDTVERGTTRNDIALGRSRLVLPVLEGATAQGTPLPPAGALRGQPTRAYVPASNGG
jgi:uncharacterized protein